MTPNDRQVLVALAQVFDQDCNCLGFARLSLDTGLERRIVRLSARRLRRKGLAEYQRGLWDDYGEPAGAGYCCTKAGFDLVADEVDG